MEPRLDAKSGLYGGGGFRLSTSIFVAILEFCEQYGYCHAGGWHHQSTCQGDCVGWLHDCTSDYFLFPKLKEHLSGTRFSSHSDVKTATGNWYNGQDVISTKPC
ncbi:hypothetical protein AVEN_106460-1 [Araneus ventricosus]|uniref:Uncharacterized protein n=1 Tax=Araneus ventricosus TaxID=182803 RepID=A0A4Y2ATC1_ARAVE|nr:hypothetical protein AVEN_106460-1 [Araneus ventricosus]